MADEYERIIDLPLAAAWDGEIAQDKVGGVTERVPVSLVEARLLADGFTKNAIPLSQKGSANGVAELDSSMKILASQLPSYVDDVLEYANQAAFPATGETGKIYVAIDSGLTYRWSGSVYSVLNPSLALGETAATAYRGDRGKTAYDHSQASGNPHGTTAAQVGAVPLAGGATLSGGKIILAPATAAYASINIPTRLASITTPVAGDIWNNGFAIGVHQRGYQSNRGESDTVEEGSFFQLLNAYGGLSGWMCQLGQSNTFDFWNQISGVWTRNSRLFPGGSLALNGASMPSWDSQSKPLMIGRNAALLESDYGSGSNVLLATNYFAASDGADKSLSASGHSQYLQLVDGGGIVFRACNNNGANGVITPAVKWSVDKDGLMLLPALANNVSKPLFADKFGNLKKDLPSDISSSFTLSDTTPFFMVVVATAVTITLPAPTDYKGLKYTFAAHSDVTLNLTSGAGIRYQDLKGSGSWAPNANNVAIVMQGTDYGGDHEIVELWSSGQRWFVRA